ncbi:nucleotidyltransferase family protein [Peptoniphilus porci]|uniref:nucleotidyltransferase family protein n=1 Tax=Peptoniphilus porci TaxID=2652280 RepID=UPI000A3F0719|nr:nucleotidyltransferase family protein [Peptoniphilus porci]
MKIASIIAEYNPFHNGHAYQIQKIKNEYSDYIIIIMSGNFVQRGEPAIINKFKRAKIAVDNGASLVLELPLIYSTSNAEIFAHGGINILNSMGIVDRLYFGSEDNSIILKNY